jgi:DNA polymerase-3 subunit epsilon
MTCTLVFDTETTGLPLRKEAHSHEGQPWVIQLAAILYRDSDQAAIGHFSTYILPSNGVLRGKIPNEKFWQENKLLASDIEPTAMSLLVSMNIFERFASRADRIVAHNMAFDELLMRTAYYRAYGNQTFDFHDRPKFCTMETLTDVMRLPGKIPGKYKWPNLAEAYKKFVDPAGFANAHDAMNDVQACAKVLFAVEQQGIPLIAIK